MSAVTAEILIAGVGVVVSIASSLFIAGSRFGQIIENQKTQGERLARIEGMFELKLKE